MLFLAVKHYDVLETHAGYVVKMGDNDKVIFDEIWAKASTGEYYFEITKSNWPNVQHVLECNVGHVINEEFNKTMCRFNGTYEEFVRSVKTNEVRLMDIVVRKSNKYDRLNKFSNYGSKGLKNKSTNQSEQTKEENKMTKQVNNSVEKEIIDAEVQIPAVEETVKTVSLNDKEFTVEEGLVAFDMVQSLIDRIPEVTSIDAQRQYVKDYAKVESFVEAVIAEGTKTFKEETLTAMEFVKGVNGFLSTIVECEDKIQAGNKERAEAKVKVEEAIKMADNVHSKVEFTNPEIVPDISEEIQNVETKLPKVEVQRPEKSNVTTISLRTVGKTLLGVSVAVGLGYAAYKYFSNRGE